MSEHQQEIFATFGNSLLEAELQRLETRIEELQSRRELIVEELGRRAIDETKS